MKTKILSALGVAFLVFLGYMTYCTIPDNSVPKSYVDKGKGFFAPTLLNAQGSQTVFAQVGTAVSDNFESSLVTTIGQAYHIAYAIFVDAPGQTCTTVSNAALGYAPPALNIEASPNNISTSWEFITNYTRVLRPSGSGVGNRYRLMSSATGAFPFIKVHLGGFDDVTCRANVYYIGAITSLDIKKYMDYGTNTDSAQVFDIDITGSSNTVITPVANTRIVIYGFHLLNATSQNIVMLDHRPDASNVILATWKAVPTGGQIGPLANTNFPMWKTGLGSSLLITLSGPTGVSGFVQFRKE